MDLKRKLARLNGAGPGARPAPPETPPAPEPTPEPEPESVPATPSNDDDRAARLIDLRGRIRALMTQKKPAARIEAPRVPLAEALPFEVEQTEHGPLHTRVRVMPATQRHGAVALHAALDARGDTVRTLTLDESTRAFDSSRALYLDTETTGLMGGTGTLPFLVGVARFEGRKLRVEQWFLPEPAAEPAMLARLASYIESASALVSYNGKSFDLPLLRARFVMNRMKPPREPPHVDLVHVSRRVYGERVDECRLTTLERDVLGFVRLDDVPSGEIPARYTDFLRTGNAAPLAAVVEHNLWDVVAMAALLGELSARVAGGEGAGRFEPADMAGLARTALRAGAHGLATALATEAATHGARKGEIRVAARASTLAARLHGRRGDHLATHRALLEALALTPDDARVHLLLAKHYEHKMRDAARALEHARLAAGAEDADALARRVARLTTRLSRQTLRLPGVD